MIEINLTLDLGHHAPGDHGISFARKVAATMKEEAIEFAANQSEISGSHTVVAKRPRVRYRVTDSQGGGEWHDA
jgi:hypothetical protein